MTGNTEKTARSDRYFVIGGLTSGFLLAVDVEAVRRPHAPGQRRWGNQHSSNMTPAEDRKP
jgi:hypothetical protein